MGDEKESGFEVVVGEIYSDIRELADLAKGSCGK